MVPMSVAFIITIPSVNTAMSCVFCAIYYSTYYLNSRIRTLSANLIAGIQLREILQFLLVQSCRHLLQILSLYLLLDMRQTDTSEIKT